MKKLFFSGLMVLFVFSFAGISGAAVDSVYEAAVVNMRGDVQVDISGTGAWIKPWIGMKLMENAMIRTGDNSAIDIVFDAEGLNILRISANTQITVDSSLVHLKEGSVMADFPNLRPGSSFVVRTPTAACAIRGSGMGVDFLQGMTVVRAFSDRVYVQGLDQDGNIVGTEVIIPEGWKALVGPDGDVDPPEGLSDNEILIFDAFVDAVRRGEGPAPVDTSEPTDTKDLQEQRDPVDGDDTSDISPSCSGSGNGNGNGPV